MLIEEESEQARVLVALLTSTAFLGLHLSIQPFKRYMLVPFPPIPRSTTASNWPVRVYAHRRLAVMNQPAADAFAEKRMALS